MNSLSHISDAELEHLVRQPSQAELQAEYTRRQKQAQDLAEVEQYTTMAQGYGQRLDQLVAEYEMRYQPLAQALASNPESKLVPELADLHRLKDTLWGLTEQYVKASLYAGLMDDPLLINFRGKPCRGRKEVDEWLTAQILSSKVGDENEKRTGRRDLWSFTLSANLELAKVQAQLLNAGEQAAKKK